MKVIEPEEFIKKTGYTSPHTIHCGPHGIYGSALGSASGDGPGGIFLMDADTFELKGPMGEGARPQNLAYDFWWHLGHDTLISSEWVDTEHGEERPQCGVAAWWKVWPQAAHLGPG